MISISRRLVLLVCVGLFAGCSSLPDGLINLGQSDTEEREEAGTETDTKKGDEVVESEAAVVIPPNPYFQNPPSISSDVRKSFGLAIDLMEQGLWQDAVDQLQPLADSNPKLSGVWLNLGICHEALGELSRAQDAFKKAVEANPTNISAHNRLAFRYRDQGEFQKAEQQYLKALEQWDYDIATHKNLGVLYDLYLNKPALALVHFKRAYELVEPEDRRLKGWVVEVERRLPREPQQ